MSLVIDWENLPRCGDGLTISPYICQVRVKEVWTLTPPPKVVIYTPPDDPEVPAEVPVPSTVLLIVLGLVVMTKMRRK